jgi:ATP-dependent Zn protease
MNNSDLQSGEGHAVSPSASVGSTAAIVPGMDFAGHDGRTPELMPRSAADDAHVANHEASHCLSGLVLFGVDSLGGSTIVASETAGGSTWGKRHSAELGSTEDDVSSDLCDQLRAVMPADFEPKSDASEIYAHCFCRVTDLLAGSAGEKLLCADAPWLAKSDLTQAERIASIVCTSAEAIELFLGFCRAEAENLVAKHCVSIQAVAAALIRHRTMTGDQIVAVVADSVAREAMIAEQKRRIDWKRTEASARAFLAAAQP